MFLWMLSDAEKQAFLALAREYAHADQRVTHHEQVLVDLLCREMGVDPHATLPEKPRAEWLAAFQSRTSRVAAMIDLLALAHADREFTEHERALVFETAQAFGFSQEELKAMADWNDDFQTLLQRSRALMRDPEPPPLPK